jgi:hypothetical protein
MQLAIRIDNLTSTDAVFLRGLAALYCDPKLRALLDGVRRGTHAMRYGARGALRVVQADTAGQPMAREQNSITPSLQHSIPPQPHHDTARN